MAGKCREKGCRGASEISNKPLFVKIGPVGTVK